MPLSTSRSSNIKLLLAAVGIAALISASFFLPIREYLESLVEWTDSLGPAGYVIYAIVYAIAAVLFFPGAILTLGAGAIFGVAGGFLVVLLGANLGAALSFIIGRSVAKEQIQARIEGNRLFRSLNKAIEKGGWKIVLLTRLSPIFPFNLLNYAYGVMPVKFTHYLAGTLAGMAPGILLYVYIGAAAGQAAAAAAGEAETGALGYIVQGAGFLATLIVTIYVTKLARQELNEKLG